MPIKFSNNASAILAASIGSGATSLNVTTGQGILFPSLSAGDYFYATLVDQFNNLEVIKVTGRIGDDMTIVRGQDNTVAKNYSAGDRLEVRLTAAGLSDIRSEAVAVAESATGNALAFAIAL